MKDDSPELRTGDSAHILVVEDSPVQTEQIRRALAGSGYDVSLAANGEEGLKEARKRRPALIISDIIMPKMDGYSMTRNVKDDERLRDIPVILLTQLIEPEEVIRGLESGADSFLTKPFHESYLLSKVKSYLEDPDGFRNRPDRKSIEFKYNGKHCEVHSGRTQTLSYLIATYENAVLKTKELEKVQEELRALNENLEKKVEKRTAALKKTNDALRSEIMERKKAEETIRRMAYFDPLTGLPNKASLYQAISSTARECGVNRRPFTLLMLDLDRFREINDALGYSQGDGLLKTVATRLKGVLADKQTLARCGADEFAVLIPGADSEHGISFAKGIINALDEPFDLPGLKLFVQASIGIGCFPGHGTEAGLLIKHVEAAMHHAKRLGNGYFLYSGKFEEGLSRRLSMAGDLRHTIESGGLLLYGQPKVELETGRISGVEALLRWEHPAEGMISPDEFIPLAEYTGLIKTLTYWLLDETVRHCFAWQEAKADIPIAINLSVRNLHDPMLLDKMRGLITTWGINPESLDVELTESAFMECHSVSDVLKRIRDMGIDIFIDDFGTGYSSLSYLHKLPVSAIKIDKSFVSNMINSKSAENIVKSIIDLTHNLNLRVIAEGVENKETYDALLQLGCDEAQGYYISKPFPVEQLTAWSKNSKWASKDQK